jgi:adenine deaminase
MDVSAENSRRLMRGALGELPADLIVTGGKLVNVYSGELLDGMEIAVIDGRICYVGPSARHARGATTETLDASGAYVAPGLVDGHTHIGHYARPFENLESLLPHGTTAVIASCDELASVFGMSGMSVFLDEVGRHAVRVYTLISMAAPQDPLLCNTAAFSRAEIVRALADPRVLGMGEVVSWLRLIQCDEEILERLILARRQGRIVHGHTAGARDQKLCAIAAAGVSSCHEPIRFEEAIERLRLGYWTMLREGSLRQDLEAILPRLIASGVSLRRLILVTDSMTPDDVEEHGHMDHVVRRAIALGLTPIKALQAVTLSPAIYSGLEHDIGGIAPGRFADLVLIDDLQRCRVREVLVGGKPAARGGESLEKSRPPHPPAKMLRSLSIGGEITDTTFKIASPVAEPKARVMELVNQNITAERLMRLRAADANVVADPANDVLKVAVFDRHHSSARPAFGFLRGFGARVGAVGLTVNLDENTLMIVGSDDHDMARCANALLDAGGGIAIVDKDQLLEMIELPLGGICSLQPWRQVGSELRRIQARLRQMGSLFHKPVFALSFLTFVTLPALRITARGLVRAKERTIVPLFVD